MKEHKYEGSVASEKIGEEKLLGKNLEKCSVNLSEIANGLSEKGKDEMLKLLMKNREERGGLKEKLFGNKKAILEHIRINYVDIDENVEIMGIKGKNIHVELPAVGEFKGYKFEFFAGDDCMGAIPDAVDGLIDDIGFERMEIVNFLVKFNEYLNEYGVNLDKDSALKNVKVEFLDNGVRKYGFVPDDITKAFNMITGQKDKWYILKDLDSRFVRKARLEWDCDSESGNGHYGFYVNGDNGYVLFKLPKSS